MAARAIDVIERDFLEHDGGGPVRVATFMKGAPDDGIQADVVGFMSQFLKYCRLTTP